MKYSSLKFTENLVNCVGFDIEWTLLTCHMKKCTSWIPFGENIFKQHMLRTLKHITFVHLFFEKCLYRVSQEECARLQEGVPYVKVYRYNPKHLCPKLNGTEIMAREKCGLLAGPHTVPVSWQSYRCPSLSVVSYDGNSAHASPKLNMYSFRVMT